MLAENIAPKQKREGPAPPQAGPSTATPTCAPEGAMSDVTTYQFIRMESTESCMGRSNTLDDQKIYPAANTSLRIVSRLMSS